MTGRHFSEPWTIDKMTRKTEVVGKTLFGKIVRQLNHGNDIYRRE